MEDRLCPLDLLGRHGLFPRTCQDARVAGIPAWASRSWPVSFIKYRDTEGAGHTPNGGGRLRVGERVTDPDAHSFLTHAWLRPRGTSWGLVVWTQARRAGPKVLE